MRTVTYCVCQLHNGQIAPAIFFKHVDQRHRELPLLMVGGTGNQVAEGGIAVAFFQAVIPEVWPDTMLRGEEKPRVDEAGSAKAPRGKTTLEVDPRNEREILDSSDRFAANDLKLSSAAHAVLLLLTLEVFDLGGELGPIRREAGQGVELRLLLQEAGAVHPLPALPTLLTFTCTREKITDETFCRLTSNDPSKKGADQSKEENHSTAFGRQLHEERRHFGFFGPFPAAHFSLQLTSDNWLVSRPLLAWYSDSAVLSTGEHR